MSKKVSMLDVEKRSQLYNANNEMEIDLHLSKKIGMAIDLNMCGSHIKISVIPNHTDISDGKKNA